MVDTLDPSRPTPFTLMGHDLVLWRDADRQWQAFADECPHRLAPLSEGRVEGDGSLLCSYHGWRFDGEGQCVALPQAEADKEADIRKNPKACAKRFPTRVEDGLLWIFGTGGPQGILESKMIEPRLDEYRSERGAINMPYNFRDLPYGWDTFMENVMDGSRVPMADDDSSGKRFKNATQAAKAAGAVHRSPTDTDGFHIGGHDFQPPMLNIYLSDDGKVSKTGVSELITLYAVPTKPGWCRIISNTVVLPAKGGLGAGMGGFTALAALMTQPKWLQHLKANAALHQDLALLHHQEAQLAKKGPEETLIPTQANGASVTFLQWLRRNGSVNESGRHGVPFEEVSGTSSKLPPRMTSPEALYDVYSTHVKNCKYCQGALANIKFARLTTALLAVACAVRAVSIWTAANAVAAVANVKYGAAMTAAASGWVYSTMAPVVSPGTSNIASTVMTAPTDAALAWFLAAAVFTLAALAFEKLRSLFYVYPVHQN